MQIELSELATLLNKSQEELTTVLKEGENWKDDAGKTLLSLFTQSRDAALAEKTKQYNDSKGNLEKKGFKEGIQAAEKKIKDMIPTLASLDGDALFTAVNEEIEKLRKGSTNLTEDQIKSSQVYIDGLKAQQAKLTAEIEKIKGEYEGKLSEFTGKETWRTVEQKVDAFYDSLELMEGVSPELKADWKETLKLKIKSGYKFKVDENGKPVIIDEKGEPMTDATGKLLDVEDVLRKSSSHIVTKVNTQRDGFGSKKTPDGKVDISSIPPPKTKKEFLEMSKKLKEQGVDVKELAKYQAQVNVATLPAE